MCRSGSGTIPKSLDFRRRRLRRAQTSLGVHESDDRQQEVDSSQVNFPLLGERASVEGGHRESKKSALEKKQVQRVRSLETECEQVSRPLTARAASQPPNRYRVLRRAKTEEKLGGNQTLITCRLECVGNKASSDANRRKVPAQPNENCITSERASRHFPAAVLERSTFDVEPVGQGLEGTQSGQDRKITTEHLPSIFLNSENSSLSSSQLSPKEKEIPLNKLLELHISPQPTVHRHSKGCLEVLPEIERENEQFYSTFAALQTGVLIEQHIREADEEYNKFEAKAAILLNWISSQTPID